MRIVNMKNFPVVFDFGFTKTYRGYAIMNEAGEFMSVDGSTIYIPSGGRRTLKEMIQHADRYTFVPLH